MNLYDSNPMHGYKQINICETIRAAYGMAGTVIPIVVQTNRQIQRGCSEYSCTAGGFEPKIAST